MLVRSAIAKSAQETGPRSSAQGATFMVACGSARKAELARSLGVVGYAVSLYCRIVIYAVGVDLNSCFLF